jgi:DNA helicase IV
VVVLRGSAGSGKTTVALHRIAYLNFDKPRRFAARRILVIVWGRAMKDYVSHVLPALGVSGVNVTTWTAWSRTAVKRHFPYLPNAVADDTPEPVTRIKLHPGLSELLTEHIKRTPGKSTSEQALDDWAHVLTDVDAITRALGDDIAAGALQRAIRWCSDQIRAVMAWVEGDRDVDAQLDAEDRALLLRAWQLRVGGLRAGKSGKLSYAHIVLDEVQDFSPVEVQVLLETADKHRSVTLAGDTRQHISKAAGFTDWISFLDRIGVESQALSTLEVSYRSTHPITRFALEVLSDASEPPPRTIRSGPPVELFRFSDHGAAVAFLAEALKTVTQNESLANIALLTPTVELSILYAKGLMDAEVPDVRRVVDQRFAFAAGVDVVEADQVKGLEFDYVIIVEAAAIHWPDTDHHRRLMHVASTRAVHQLWLTSVRTPSSILPKSIR